VTAICSLLEIDGRKRKKNETRNQKYNITTYRYTIYVHIKRIILKVHSLQKDHIKTGRYTNAKCIFDCPKKSREDFTSLENLRRILGKY